MAHYSFVTVWKLEAPLEKVYQTIQDTAHYHCWWKGQQPVENMCAGNADGVGAVRKFKTRSILPYTLTYTGTVVEVEPYKRVLGTATGELQGTGTWLFKYASGITTVEYDWVVDTNSRLMNFLSPLMRPLFIWNHNVVMRWGGEGLAKYLGCKLIPS